VDIVIEPERPADHAAVRAVVLAAFADQPSVAELVELIRASPEYVPELALVARVAGEVAGFVMVSHAELVDDSVVIDDSVLAGDSGRRHRVLTLSPLAVAPALQGRGIGSALVPAALQAAERLGEPLVLLEGSPRYYPRFGFRDCREFGISIPLPDWAPPDAAMVFPLSAYDARVRGRLVYPPAFTTTGTGHS
jgi:putative acetyltransferase